MTLILVLPLIFQLLSGTVSKKEMPPLIINWRIIFIKYGFIPLLQNAKFSVVDPQNFAPLLFKYLYKSSNNILIVSKLQNRLYTGKTGKTDPLKTEESDPLKLYS